MKNAILFHIFLLCICCMACTGTTKEPVADVTLDELPSIFPDYADVTIPPHIAPLRFRLSEPGDGTAFGAGDHKLVERHVRMSISIIWYSRHHNIQNDAIVLTSGRKGISIRAIIRLIYGIIILLKQSHQSSANIIIIFCN